VFYRKFDDLGNGKKLIPIPGIPATRPTKGKNMKKKLLNGASILFLAVAALGLAACANTDEGGTHLMGGRGQSGTMADEMMPGNQ
jgi:predicted small secreted protein